MIPADLFRLLINRDYEYTAILNTFNHSLELLIQIYVVYSMFLGAIEGSIVSSSYGLAVFAHIKGYQRRI